MGINSIVTDQAGQIGFNPRIVKIISTDNLATVTTAGYLNPISLEGYSILNTDEIHMWYGWVSSSNPGTFGVFTAAISNGVITLSKFAGQGGITLPTVANHLMVSTDTLGTIANLTGTAINDGSVQAGRSTVAGSQISFPATASKGSLALTAVANTGDTRTTISNAAMGQASTISIPDPAGATANFVIAPAALVSGNLVKASGTAGLVADAGAKIIANTTASYAGGGTSNAFTATGLTSASVGSAVIRASTNVVGIAKALPGTNTLTITFTADPGASTTVDYIYVTAAQS